MRKCSYSYNCVSPANKKELFHIIDNNREITRETFCRNVDSISLKELEESLGYDRRSFPMKNDWHVSYHSAEYKGRRIYFLVQSGIEYVFSG